MSKKKKSILDLIRLEMGGDPKVTHDRRSGPPDRRSPFNKKIRKNLGKEIEEVRKDINKHMQQVERILRAKEKVGSFDKLDPIDNAIYSEVYNDAREKVADLGSKVGRARGIDPLFGGRGQERWIEDARGFLRRNLTGESYIPRGFGDVSRGRRAGDGIKMAPPPRPHAREVLKRGPRKLISPFMVAPIEFALDAEGTSDPDDQLPTLSGLIEFGVIQYLQDLDLLDAPDSETVPFTQKLREAEMRGARGFEKANEPIIQERIRQQRLPRTMKNTLR